MRLELIKELALAAGPSSKERAVREILSRELARIGVDFRIDRMGNLTATLKRGENAPRVALFSHMDEVGMMLTEVDEEGFFRFEPLGRASMRALSGRFVTVLGQGGACRGIIAAKGIHLQDKEERQKLPEVEQMYLDIGARDRADAEQHAKPGDLCVFDTPFATFGKDGKYISCKALDARVGCAILLSVLERSARGEAPIDLSVAFLARLEAVPAAAATALTALRPEIAVLVDAFDTKDQTDRACGAFLGGGAVLPFADGRTLYDRRQHALLRRAADKEGVAYTIPTGTWRDADAMQLHRAGVGMRCLCVGYPVRYAKTPASVADVTDIEKTEQLLVAYLTALSKGEK